MPRKFAHRSFHSNHNFSNVRNSSFKNKILIKEMGGDDPRPSLDVKIFGQNLLDSGSRVTVLGKNSDDLIKRWNLNIKPYRDLVTNASGDRVGILGTVYLPFELNGKTHVLKTLIENLVLK
jgi:hypothetical protein